MDERSQERIEKSKTCKHDADCVNGYRSGEVLPDNPASPLRDGDRFDEAGQIVTQQYDISAFTRHISTRSHSDADIRLDQCGGVVDAVAEHRNGHRATPSL